MKRLFVLFLLLACGVASGSADPAVEGWFLSLDNLTYTKAGIAPAFAKCMNSEENRSVAGRRYCLGEENARQDKRLNTAYQATLKRLSPARAALLRESQRGWLRMLPNHCQLEAGDTGGTDQVEADALCHLYWRAYRATYLEALFPV